MNNFWIVESSFRLYQSYDMTDSHNFVNLKVVTKKGCSRKGAREGEQATTGPNWNRNTAGSVARHFKDTSWPICPAEWWQSTCSLLDYSTNQGKFRIWQLYFDTELLTEMANRTRFIKYLQWKFIKKISSIIYRLII